MPRTTIITLLSILLACSGCGSKSKDTGDADGAEDAPAETTTDGSGEPAEDPAPDGHEDPADDPADDPAEEPDAAPDAEEDAEDDQVSEPVDDVVDAVDASDASDGGGADGSGASPSLLRYAKGTEITTGACNPDGSTTEALVATDAGGGCIDVTHYCAWMNGCSTLVATLAYTPPSTLTITETETGAFCYHEGWFNPRFSICGLTSGTWTVGIGTLTTTVTVP
ncbi:MAG: hypothetical protein JRG91_14865 [Deltaproteobacteria bacterium]|nr:hypothetical protein [Deltaproteobacteria bacterium]